MQQTTVTLHKRITTTWFAHLIRSFKVMVLGVLVWDHGIAITTPIVSQMIRLGFKVIDYMNF